MAFCGERLVVRPEPMTATMASSSAATGRIYRLRRPTTVGFVPTPLGHVSGTDAALSATNVDTILDFEHKVDDIALSQAIFTAIGTTLSKGEFFIGSKAHDGNDHIIYNAKNGKLFYDDDGKGGDAKIQFALLDDHLKLNHNDFIMVA